MKQMIQKKESYERSKFREVQRMLREKTQETVTL